MESFCAGIVNVNKWTEVEFEEDKDPVLLEVDLNFAIRKAFEGMTSVDQYGIVSIISRSHQKLLSHSSLPAVGLSSHQRHSRQRPSSSTTYPSFVQSALTNIYQAQRAGVCLLCSMSTLQVERGLKCDCSFTPSPRRSSLMECVVAEPVVCVPSPSGNKISSIPNENIDEPLVIDPLQMTKATQMLDVTEVESGEMDIYDELPDHGCLEKDEILTVGMRFAKLQLAHGFYVTYAKKVGFATKIRMTTFDKITKEPVNQAIHCNRDRIRGSRVKAPTHKNPISVVGCKARIYVKFDKEKQEWLFFKVELRHSHPCSTKKAVHYHEYRHLTMHAKCVIQNNNEAGIRPNKTFLALANEVGGPSNLGFLEKDLRNYITARLRTSNINADVREMMNYFIRMKDINPNFFYAVKLDDECRFRSAVWVDARCRASYEYYGDVVSFDSTYSTNRHGLPFASFVGVNHHGKSSLLGCALLGNEKIPSYGWSIITNQCRFMFGAIRKALPNTRHRWCIWHIMKKLPQKLGGYRRYGDLYYANLRDIVFNTWTEESFERKWFEFIEEYNLHDNTWLSDIYNDRRMWVPIFFKGEFWTAMRSTQRSESMHAFYGGFLHSKTSLVQFVHEYDNVLEVKEQRKLEDDVVDSRGVIPCATSSPMER
ncbi:hypothetical protein Ahy_B06g081422 [Arachis hypogaea]|uniref:Uncharacterized protein n=1 Tax=Arachis hypogaea TaxID=3818 RepID=A0A444YL26_ARAHY|nr:hypothetical protein Ahy_B06g081422 [Arachis hypogaea]